MESFLNAFLESPSFPRAFSGNPGEARLGLVLVARARPKTGRGDEHVHESRTRLELDPRFEHSGVTPLASDAAQFPKEALFVFHR